MPAATQRVPVLMTAKEKARVAKKAKEAGLSMGEYLRRAAAAFRPGEDNQALEAVIGQMLIATERAERAIDDTIAFVEESNRRIAALEAQKKVA